MIRLSCASASCGAGGLHHGAHAKSVCVLTLSSSRRNVSSASEVGEHDSEGEAAGDGEESARDGGDGALVTDGVLARLRAGPGEKLGDPMPEPAGEPSGDAS